MKSSRLINEYESAFISSLPLPTAWLIAGWVRCNDCANSVWLIPERSIPQQCSRCYGLVSFSYPVQSQVFLLPSISHFSQSTYNLISPISSIKTQRRCLSASKTHAFTVPWTGEVTGFWSGVRPTNWPAFTSCPIETLGPVAASMNTVTACFSAIDHLTFEVDFSCALHPFGYDKVTLLLPRLWELS